MDRLVIKNRFDAVKRAEAALNAFDAEHPGVNKIGGRDDTELWRDRLDLLEALADTALAFTDYFCRREEDAFRALFNLPPSGDDK